MMPLVSIVVPLWNSARYLAETIDSVSAQEVEDIELVFVDDGSTDRSAELVRSMAPRAIYRHQPHRGISAALNHGIALATGQYLTFLDADDLLPTGSLAARLAASRVQPELDLIAGHVKQFASPELDADLASSFVFSDQPVPGYLLGAMLVRRAAFASVGGFDESVPAAQSVDWVIRALDARLRLGMIPDVVLQRRLHRDNHSHAGLQIDAYPRILKASLDRRRALSGGRAALLPEPEEAGGGADQPADRSSSPVAQSSATSRR
jgi:glycosyltransferase involved in cell wall biosynthesis